jgi:hypothetical protein
MVIEYYYNKDEFEFFKVNDEFTIKEINIENSVESSTETDNAYIRIYQFEFEDEGLVVIKLKEHVDVVEYISNVFQYKLNDIIRMIDNKEIKQKLIERNLECMI